MATPPRDSKAGTSAPPDASTVTGYWVDMMQATSTFWLSQAGRWSKALEQMRGGTYAPSTLMQDMALSMDDWTMLMATPCQWVPHAERQLPTFLFVVDGD